MMGFFNRLAQRKSSSPFATAQRRIAAMLGRPRSSSSPSSPTMLSDRRLFPSFSQRSGEVDASRAASCSLGLRRVGGINPAKDNGMLDGGMIGVHQLPSIVSA